MSQTLGDAMHKVAVDVGTLGDIERALREVRARRIRITAGTLAAACLALLLVVSLPTPASIEPIGREPTPTSPPAGTRTVEVQVLPPYCALQDYLSEIPEPYLASPGCPSPLGAGRALGAISGGHLIRLVDLQVPGPDWEAKPLGSYGQGFELLSPQGNGVTAFAYPSLSGAAGDSLEGRALLAALKGRPDVRVVDSGEWDVGGWGGTWIDVTPARGATLAATCRLAAPCVPLLAAQPREGGDAVELRPGVVSRLFVEGGGGFNGLAAAVWVHDAEGPDADAALRIVASMDMSVKGGVIG